MYNQKPTIIFDVAHWQRLKYQNIAFKICTNDLNERKPEVTSELG
jgi:hypothetical protein